MDYKGFVLLHVLGSYRCDSLTPLDNQVLTTIKNTYHNLQVRYVNKEQAIFPHSYSTNVIQIFKNIKIFHHYMHPKKRIQFILHDCFTNLWTPLSQLLSYTHTLEEILYLHLTRFNHVIGCVKQQTVDINPLLQKLEAFSASYHCLQGMQVHNALRSLE